MLAQFFVNSLISGSIYMIVALSFSIIYTTTNFFHFAHGAIFILGAYFAYLYTSMLGIWVLISLPLGILTATIVGILIELLIYRPLRRKGTTALILLLSSLGIYIVLQNLISMVFGDDTKTLRTGPVQEGVEIFGGQITPIQIMIVIVSFIMLVGCSLLLRYTKTGKAMRAIASNPTLALVSGIDIDKVFLFAFTLGSALAALAGVLISYDIDMTPTMGLNFLMMGVVAVIVGGVGSIQGAAFGGFLLAFAQNFGVWNISSQWQDAIAFVVLLLFLLIRPHGFFGKKIRRVEV